MDIIKYFERNYRHLMLCTVMMIKDVDRAQDILHNVAVTISQSLYNDSVLWSRANSTTEDSIDTIELAIGIKAYLSTMEDGTVYAVAFDTGHDINVISTMLSLEELKEVLLNIRYMD